MTLEALFVFMQTVAPELPWQIRGGVVCCDVPTALRVHEMGPSAGAPCWGIWVGAHVTYTRFTADSDPQQVLGKLVYLLGKAGHLGAPEVVKMNLRHTRTRIRREIDELQAHLRVLDEKERELLLSTTSSPALLAIQARLREACPELTWLIRDEAVHAEGTRVWAAAPLLEDGYPEGCWILSDGDVFLNVTPATPALTLADYVAQMFTAAERETVPGTAAVYVRFDERWPDRPAKETK